MTTPTDPVLREAIKRYLTDLPPDDLAALIQEVHDEGKDAYPPPPVAITLPTTNRTPMSRFTRSDARILNRVVTAAGAQLPDVLTALLDAANEIHRADTNPADDPLTGLADAAADGKVTAAKITSAFTKAGAQAAQAATAQQTRLAAERAVMDRFARELRGGGADEIVNSLRPAFNAHIDGIRAIAEGIDNITTVDPEAFLATADAETLALWQSIPTHVSALDRIAGVADLFTHAGAARVITHRSSGTRLDGLDAISGRILYCTTDQIDLTTAVGYWRANGPGRHSAWFRLYGVAQLRTVDEARERLRGWCEAAFDAAQRARQRNYSTVGGQLVEDAPQPNPYRTEAAV
ncbi:hypothetical protein FR943_12930 [Mycobacterium sp. TNTM28]|uniref:Uncharacterized protein n=1 Tax=[Mycobacterium] fortunisiensis TaxID=2600579 RepID=A0ABS6KMF3_9MYCO|nr:hypothetical protein [[Mycobacterium] fortunisiensis]MBU9764747.1 hypothetical protein [[Mycobacterium] fortunisiensis]